MPFVSASIGRLFALRWVGRPEEPDIDELLRITATLQKEARELIHFVAIIPEDTDSPSATVRRRMVGTADELLSHCAGMHLIVEGDGIRASLNRALVRAMMLVSRHRSKVHFPRDPPAALRQIGSELGTTREQALAALSAQGIMR